MERSRIWLVEEIEKCGVYLVCTQRECKPNETVIEQYTKMFESRTFAGATENYRGGKNLKHQQRGPTTWQDMPKKCVERYCELANEKV